MTSWEEFSFITAHFIKAASLSEVVCGLVLCMLSFPRPYGT